MDVQAILDGYETRAKALGKSVAALCKDARVESSQWRRWRRGKTSPTVESLNKIETALKADPSASQTDAA